MIDLRLLICTLVSAALLAGCGANPSAPSVPDGSGGFRFDVDPTAGQVTFVDTIGTDAGLASQYVPSQTVLLAPERDLELVGYDVSFGPANTMTLHATFRNNTTVRGSANPRRSLLQPFFFTLNPATRGIVGATMPDVTDTLLGGDGVLQYDETTAQLPFYVVHRGEPFTFFVDAHAFVPGTTGVLDLSWAIELDGFAPPSEHPSMSAGGSVVFDSANDGMECGLDTNDARDVFSGDPSCGGNILSLSTTGQQGDGDSWAPAISADGSAVSFTSVATNLVPGDTNGVADVFVTEKGRVSERVSVASSGLQANAASMDSAISGDGRYVAFRSAATNLVPDDTNGVSDVFVRDRVAGTTERVSISSAGEQGNRDSFELAISADGRWVAFRSWADNLVAGDLRGFPDIFVHDRATGETTRVSVPDGGGEADGLAYAPAISADGRFVAFWSDANNLVPGDTNDAQDVFVHDRATDRTERVSVDSFGQQAIGGTHQLFPYAPSLSSDGRFVAFDTDAANLVEDDTNGTWDVFVRDRDEGWTQRVSVDNASFTMNGVPIGGNDWSRDPAISANGRLVAFTSNAGNFLEPYDPHDVPGPDVFVHDRLPPRGY